MTDFSLSAAEIESLLLANLRLLQLPDARVIDVQTKPATALSHLLDVIEGEPAVIRAAMKVFVKAVNELCDGALRKDGRVNASAVEMAEDGFRAIAARFDVDLEDPSTQLRRRRDALATERALDVAAVDATIRARVVARQARDFETADRLQQELLAQGVVLLDSAEGTDWTLTRTPDPAPRTDDEAAGV